MDVLPPPPPTLRPKPSKRDIGPRKRYANEDEFAADLAVWQQERDDPERAEMKRKRHQAQKQRADGKRVRSDRTEAAREQREQKIEDEKQELLTLLEHELSESPVSLSALHLMEPGHKDDGLHSIWINGITCASSGEILLSCQTMRTGPHKVRDTKFGGYVSFQEEAHYVLVLSAQGSVLRKIGSHGTTPGCFDQPHGLACCGESVYVADHRNRRVQQFDVATGAFQNLLGFDAHPRCMHTVGDQILVSFRDGHPGTVTNQISVLRPDLQTAAHFNVTASPPGLDACLGCPSRSVERSRRCLNFEIIALTSHGGELFVLVRGDYMGRQPEINNPGGYHLQVWDLDRRAFIRAVKVPQDPKFCWEAGYEEPLQGFGMTCTTAMTIVQASPHEEPILLLNGARRFPFGDEHVLLEQILRLNLDGTPLDRIRVVPPVSGMCVSQSGSVYIAAHGKGNSERSTRLPCQLQCGVLSL